MRHHGTMVEFYRHKPTIEMTALFHLYHEEKSTGMRISLSQMLCLRKEVTYMIVAELAAGNAEPWTDLIRSFRHNYQTCLALVRKIEIEFFSWICVMSIL